MDKTQERLELWYSAEGIEFKNADSHNLVLCEGDDSIGVAEASKALNERAEARDILVKTFIGHMS